jgi:hypothetical protein
VGGDPQALALGSAVEKHAGTRAAAGWRSELRIVRMSRPDGVHQFAEELLLLRAKQRQSGAA